MSTQSTAQGCRNVADAHNASHVHKEYHKIIEKVKQLSQKGQYSYNVNIKHRATKRKLEDEGFIVYFNDYGWTTNTILW